MDTTAKAMIEFFEKAGGTGRIKPNTAHSLSTAAKQILKIDDNWEQIDLAQLDVDEFLARFRNLNGLKYKPRSLAEYERRFKKATQLYLEYVANPATWKFNGKSRRKPKSGRGTETLAVEQQTTGNVETTTVGIAPGGLQMMDYPFPLRDGCIVRLRLPADLKMSEVGRLAAFMRTITIDDNTGAA